MKGKIGRDDWIRGGLKSMKHLYSTAIEAYEFFKIDDLI